MPRSLYGRSQCPLVLGTGASPAARLNLTPVTYVTAEFRRVLIVYYIYLIPTEKTDSAFRWVTATAPPRLP